MDRALVFAGHIGCIGQRMGACFACNVQAMGSWQRDVCVATRQSFRHVVRVSHGEVVLLFCKVSRCHCRCFCMHASVPLTRCDSGRRFCAGTIVQSERSIAFVASVRRYIVLHAGSVQHVHCVLASGDLCGDHQEACSQVTCGGTRRFSSCVSGWRQCSPHECLACCRQ